MQVIDASLIRSPASDLSNDSQTVFFIDPPVLPRSHNFTSFTQLSELSKTMKNKKTSLLLFLALAPLSVLAQEKAYSCSHVKSHPAKPKSNALTVAEIAETERYDVHY